ncbi:MAG TPA: glycosyltransferase family 2 protein [Phototrophicaceae bacterium]|nr:glycosyltransferase family 2 protein [Phototrophicaceae bacterium]
MEQKILSINQHVGPFILDETTTDISVVIPLYNEAESIPSLYNELTEVLSQLPYSYEVIVVDDGSRDESFARLKTVHEHDPRWRIIRLRQNFGQTAGMAAGFEAAQGRIVITTDADLQNDPHDIPQLLEKFEEGYDIVSGWRMNRKEPFFSRRLPSMLANRLISRTTHVALHDYGCTLKAYHRDVVKNVRLYGELHRFIPALASWMGVRIAEVPVNDRARRFGKSKYGIGRTFRVILDLITVSFLLRFATKPLHVFGGLGFVVTGLGAMMGLYLAYVKFFVGEGIGDRPLLLLAVVLVILGIQLISTGLVAELVMRVYYEPRGRPIYMVRERLERTAEDLWE